MSRVSRNVFVGFPHHVTQRGNFKQDVFLCDEDRHHYLNWLNHYKKKYQLDIWAYCLMNNHVHLIVVPAKPDSIARTLATTHMRHSQYLNKRLDRTGHVWQGRFYSCPMDDEHLLRAAIYVERNPVRAGLVSSAADWEWSSAAAHYSGEMSPLLKNNSWPTEDLLESWGSFLEEPDKPETAQLIHKQTSTGRPLGSASFITKLERMSGKLLRALPTGRPKKEIT